VYSRRALLERVQIGSAFPSRFTDDQVVDQHVGAGLSGLCQQSRAQVTQFALTARLPTMFTFGGPVVRAGGLIAYGPSLSDLYRRAAVYVRKILEGARPGDLPVEQPTTFELIINRQTARALGLTIPPSVLLQASQLID